MKLRLALAALLAAALACNTLLPPRPELTWDPSPDSIVLETYVAGGLAPMNYMRNYIPDARVWGDGRILWVETNGSGRRVLEGRLSEEELRALLQQFSDAGFFGWEAHYAPPYQVYDAGTTVLMVNLLSTRKQVTEYFEGAPARFHELAALLRSGAGVSGADFTPERIYLTAFPISDTQSSVEFFWPDQAAGFALAEATAGRYVEGEALLYAWQVVNHGYYSIVESAGRRYQLVVQVPGVSLEEPP
jgi:hypothetical protein